MIKSEKIGEYCSNIIKTWQDSKKRVSYIPICIAILPPIAKGIVEKSSMHDCLSPANLVYAITVGILFFWYYASLDTKNRLEADKGYYDTEILAMRDKTIQCMQQKTLIGKHIMATYQISQISKAMDYAITHFRKMIEQPILTTDEVFTVTDDLINAVYNLIKNYYQDYQEKLNMALYYYSPSTKKYYDMISRKHDTSEHKKGRIWDENDNSHVCFVGRQKNSYSIIYDNINDKLPEPENSDLNDKSTYVSSISAPIRLINSEHTNYILSLTSNFENRFSNDTSDEFINAVNDLFSLFIVNVSTLLEIAFNRNLKGKDDEILNHILEDYKNNRFDELKKHELDGILSNLS